MAPSSRRRVLLVSPRQAFSPLNGSPDSENHKSFASHFAQDAASIPLSELAFAFQAQSKRGHQSPARARTIKCAIAPFVHNSPPWGKLGRTAYRARDSFATRIIQRKARKLAKLSSVRHDIGPIRPALIQRQRTNEGIYQESLRADAVRRKKQQHSPRAFFKQIPRARLPRIAQSELGHHGLGKLPLLCARDDH